MLPVDGGGGELLCALLRLGTRQTLEGPGCRNLQALSLLIGET